MSCVFRTHFLIAALSLVVFFISTFQVNAFTFTTPLQEGDSGKAVSTLQTILQNEGFFTYPSVTGYFGPVTLQAVADFQRAHGLEPIGYVGPQTRHLLNGLSINTPFVSTANLLNNNTENAQIFLKTLGFFTYPSITGYFGPVTQNAVTEFQQANDLTPTGELDQRSYLTLVVRYLQRAVTQLSSADSDDTETTTVPAPTETTPTDTTTPDNAEVLTTPTNLASAVTAYRAAVTWQKVDGATSYKIERSNSRDSEYAVLAIDLTKPAYTDYSVNAATYYYRVYALNDTDTSDASEAIRVTVPRENEGGGSVTDTTAPNISSVSASAGSSTSTITWFTDEDSNSKVLYGTTDSYGSIATSSSNVTSHSISLSSLTASTTYHYVVVSADVAGNTSTSSDATFTTNTSTFVVGNQTIEFGALTPANAGGATTTASSGTISTTTILSGNSSGHWQISSTGVITPTSAGDSADLNAGPYSLSISFGDGTSTDTATITINTSGNDANGVDLATSYSVADIDEARTVANGTIAFGATVLFRSGTYNEGQDITKSFKRTADPTGTWSGPSLISSAQPDKGYDLDTANWVTLRPHAGASTTISWLVIDGNSGATKYLRFTGFTITRPALTTLNATTRARGAVYAFGVPSYISIDNNTVSSNDTPSGDATDVHAGIAFSGGASNCFIYNNTVSGVGYGVSVGGTSCQIIGNSISNSWEDAIQTSPGDDQLIAWNTVTNKKQFDASVGAHADFFQNNDAGASANIDNFRIIGNRISINEGRSGYSGGQGYFADDLNASYQYTNFFSVGNMGVIDTFQAHSFARIGSGGYVGHNTIVADPGYAIGQGTYKFLSSDSAKMVYNIGAGFVDSTPVGASTLAYNHTVDADASSGSTSYSEVFDDPQSRGNITGSISTHYAVKTGSVPDSATVKIGAHANYIDYTNREFDLPDRENVTLSADFTDATTTVSTATTSDKITVTGINTTQVAAGLTSLSPSGVLVRIGSGTGEFRVYQSDGSTVISDWGSDPVLVTGQSSIQVQLQATSSANYSQSATISLEVGNKSVDWKLSTEAGVGAFVTYLGSAVDISNLTTYTFSGESLGSAAANRYILVSVSTRGVSAHTHDTVTVGGVTATQVATVLTGVSRESQFIANVPTGSTGDIVVTNSTGVSRCGVAWWNLDNPLNGVVASATTTASLTDPLALTINVPANGGVIASVSHTNGTLSTTTNVTKDYDESIESTVYHVGGSKIYTSAQTGLGVTVDMTGISNSVGVASAWAPTP